MIRGEEENDRDDDVGDSRERQNPKVPEAIPLSPIPLAPESLPTATVTTVGKAVASGEMMCSSASVLSYMCVLCICMETSLMSYSIWLFRFLL